MKYSHYGIKTSIILETGYILLFQKLKLLIMVLRVLDISILKSVKLYQDILVFNRY